MNMFRSKRVWLGLMVVIGLVGVGVRATDGHSVGDIPAGTGYSAWELCTRTMQAGENFDHVRSQYVEPKVNPLSRMWQVDYAKGRSVTVGTRLPFMQNSRTAVFRPGLGCTLLPPGTTEAGVRAQPFQPAAALPANTAPWPLGEGASERDAAT